MEQILTIKDLYNYCKEQGCEDAEMEIHYEYGCYDGDWSGNLELDDFEIKRYQDSFDGGKTWKECHTLVLRFCK